MKDKQLCVNDGFGFDLPVSERLRLIRRAGFDGFFSDWKPAPPRARGLCISPSTRRSAR